MGAHPYADALARSRAEATAANGRGESRLRSAEPHDTQPSIGTFRLPRPLSMRELVEAKDPPESWIADKVVPTGANVLVVGGPKSHKTNLLLDLAVSSAVGGRFLQKFGAKEPRRVGVVLMEGARLQLKKRLQRICETHGVTLADVENLFCWFRPPLSLEEGSESLHDLRTYVEHYKLDVLAVDCWAYVARGDSRNEDDVVRQLRALSSLRGTNEALSVVLLHHARKPNRDEREPGRLTDEARGSSAFGGWYDAGLLLSRANATAPVRVDVELRDYPSPEPFSFAVEDEFPGEGEEWPSGYLRLRALEEDPHTVERDAVAEKFLPLVEKYLKENPGCSKNDLEKGVRGDNRSKRAALTLLCEQGKVRYESRGPNRGCWWVGLEGGAE